MSFALGLYDQVLRMLHPIMPFVTEEIWQTLMPREDGTSISTVEFPECDETKIDRTIESEFRLMQETVEGIRRMRSEANLPPSREITISIVPTDVESERVYNNVSGTLRSLTRIGDLNVAQDLEKPPLSKTEVVLKNEVHLHLDGLIDIEEEKEKTRKEIARIEGQIVGTEKKLGNEAFVNNAPDAVVQKERDKLGRFSVRRSRSYRRRLLVTTHRSQHHQTET